MPALRDPPYNLAAEIILSLGTPVIFSTCSGVKSSTDFFHSSKPSECLSMKSLSYRPSFTIMCAIPFNRATSVPGLNCKKCSANRTIGTFRGSAMMIFAPFRYPLIIRLAMTGWVSFVLEPIMKITSAFSISVIEFVIAPEPNMAARLATVGLCQRRAQWSTLLVPIALLMNFWKR